MSCIIFLITGFLHAIIFSHYLIQMLGGLFYCLFNSLDGTLRGGNKMYYFTNVASVFGYIQHIVPRY